MKLAQANKVRIETLVADLANLTIEPERWDAVISIFCHVPSGVRRELHRKVAGGLRSGGVLVLEAYTPAQLKLGTGGPPSEDMMMTLSSLRHEFDGLVFKHAVELERDVIEGKLHTGRGAVVQLVAVKP